MRIWDYQMIMHAEEAAHQEDEGEVSEYGRGYCRIGMVAVNCDTADSLTEISDFDD